MDIAVVGGGITGLFAAYYLQREGAVVTLFEKDELGAGSVHAAGILEPENFYRINTLAYLRRAGMYWRNGSTVFRSLDLRWFFGYISSFGREPSQAGWNYLHGMGDFSMMEYAAMAEANNDFRFARNGLIERYKTSAIFEQAVAATRAKRPHILFEIREERGNTSIPSSYLPAWPVGS